MTTIKGLTFNGIHSSSLGITLGDDTIRPLLAEIKDSFDEIPYRDGSILIKDSTRKDINVMAPFFLTEPSVSSVFSTARSIAEWLKTDSWAPLVFDDDPGYIYKAKVTGAITLENITDFEKFKEFTVTFRCSPNPWVE